MDLALAKKSAFVLDIAPPSPRAPRFFVGKKLNVPKAPTVPANLPEYLPLMNFAPNACAVSSTIGIPVAIFSKDSISAHCPYK